MVDSVFIIQAVADAHKLLGSLESENAPFVGVLTNSIECITCDVYTCEAYNPLSTVEILNNKPAKCYNMWMRCPSICSSRLIVGEQIWGESNI